MAWVRIISWTSKKSFADCLKHYKKSVVPALKDSPATSVKVVQTGPNSGLNIMEFADKRALNQHEKLSAAVRKQAGKDLQMRMTVHDGPVRASR